MRRLRFHPSRTSAGRPPGRLASRRVAGEGSASDPRAPDLRARGLGPAEPAGAGEGIAADGAGAARRPAAPPDALARAGERNEAASDGAPAPGLSRAPVAEIRPALAIEAVRDAWLDLAERALEPHPFGDPDLLVAAAKHLPWTRRPEVLLVWDAGAALAPAPPPAPRPLEPFLREVGAAPPPPAPGRLLAAVPLGLVSALLPNGTPLLDRERAAEALDLALRHLAGAGRPALHLRGLDADGPLVALLEAAAGARGARIVRLNAHRRAALRAPAPAGAATPDGQGPRPDGARPEPAKRVEPKNLARLRRRLAERGAVDGPFPAGTGAGERGRVEAFLRLEAAGWKGRAGTALLASPATAGFARAGLRSLAERDRLRVATLSLDGRPIAAGLVLRMGRRAAFWKIAFDEAFGAYSPGALLTLDLRRALAAGEAGVSGAGVSGADVSADPWAQLELVDSCAIEDHPMIDRLWPGRIGIVDVVAPTGRAGFAITVAAVRLRSALRRSARRVRAALRRRARPPAP